LGVAGELGVSAGTVVGDAPGTAGWPFPVPLAVGLGEIAGIGEMEPWGENEDGLAAGGVDAEQAASVMGASKVMVPQPTTHNPARSPGRARSPAPARACSRNHQARARPPCSHDMITGISGYASATA